MSCKKMKFAKEMKGATSKSPSRYDAIAAKVQLYCYSIMTS